MTLRRHATTRSVVPHSASPRRFARPRARLTENSDCEDNSANVANGMPLSFPFSSLVISFAGMCSMSRTTNFAAAWMTLVVVAMELCVLWVHASEPQNDANAPTSVPDSAQEVQSGCDSWEPDETPVSALSPSNRPSLNDESIRSTRCFVRNGLEEGVSTEAHILLPTIILAVTIGNRLPRF